MKKTVSFILCLLTVSVFILIFIQEKSPIFEIKPLNGVNNEPEVVDFTFDNVYHGKYQTYLETSIRYNFGFREMLLRLHNQYIWDFYKKTEVNSVFLGKDNWLYFYEMVMDDYQSMTYKYCSSIEEMEQTFERDALMVYYLQEILKDYGTTLFVCIAPSKNELYPEYIPETNNIKHREGIHADEYYVNRFSELGVNCLDLNTLYKSLKDNTDYPLFYKSGSHYSYIAATYNADTLVKFMEAASGLNIQDFGFSQPYINEPKKIDRDMENLLNLQRPIENVKYQYVDLEPIPDSTSVKPRWLTIGDSFYWNISGKLIEAGIFESTPFWYYAKEVYNTPGKRDINELNIVDELIKADVVMILWCPINLYAMEHNLINNAVLSFCECDNYRYNLINTMKNSEEWYNDVVEKAKKKNVTVDEMLVLDANYMMTQKVTNNYTNKVAVPTNRSGKAAAIKKYFEGKSVEEIQKIKAEYRDSLYQKAIETSSE